MTTHCGDGDTTASSRYITDVVTRLTDKNLEVAVSTAEPLEAGQQLEINIDDRDSSDRDFRVNIRGGETTASFDTLSNEDALGIPVAVTGSTVTINIPLGMLETTKPLRIDVDSWTGDVGWAGSCQLDPVN